LLINAGISGPYVLVGHSFGGYNIRLYTSEYPDEVVGMVLVDTTPEDGFKRVAALLPPPTPGECQALTASRSEVVANREGVDFPTSTEQVRQARHSLGDLPLIILARGRASQTPAGCNTPASLNTQIDQVYEELQADLARLSANSKYIIAEKSGHQIQLDQPELVIDAIGQVVQAARTGARLASS
jgi:pimeloyl-ACP methyl ester carboxylesterase